MSEQWKLCSNCGNVPMATSNHTILCNTCHRESLPEIWQSRPLEDALLARAEHAETDAVFCLRYENEALKSMIERLIEAGNLVDYNYQDLWDRDSKHIGKAPASLFEWHALVSKYRGEQ